MGFPKLLLRLASVRVSYLVFPEEKKKEKE